MYGNPDCDFVKQYRGRERRKNGKRVQFNWGLIIIGQPDK